MRSQESIKKGIETRRRNTAERRKLQEEAKTRILSLQNEIELLEKSRNSLAMITKIESIATLNTRLLDESEIVNSSAQWLETYGIYFLIQNKKVVYVGQAKNIFSRIGDHAKTKEFDSFTYIVCKPAHTDILESLYIHMLKPKLNGVGKGGEKLTPINFPSLLRRLEQAA